MQSSTYCFSLQIVSLLNLYSLVDTEQLTKEMESAKDAAEWFHGHRERYNLNQVECLCHTVMLWVLYCIKETLHTIYKQIQQIIRCLKHGAKLELFACV